MVFRYCAVPLMLRADWKCAIMIVAFRPPAYFSAASRRAVNISRWSLRRPMMSPLFGKKQFVYAIAETIEDGTTLMNLELKKIKYREYRGAEPMLEVLVRVMPETEPSFETKMKTGLSKVFLLKPGVRVRVKYEPNKTPRVFLEDEIQAILERNPQIIKDGK
jgi:hypothetical protein